MFLSRICLLALLLGGMTACLGTTYQINSRAMEPLLVEGDLVLARPVNVADLQRGDVVVYATPGYEDNLHTKRIVALPGETIEIKGGIIYVDGAILTEAYAVSQMPPGTYIPTLMLGANEFYILGDNRLASADSRVHGPIPGDLIRGKVTVAD